MLFILLFWGLVIALLVALVVSIFIPNPGEGFDTCVFRDSGCASLALGVEKKDTTPDLPTLGSD